MAAQQVLLKLFEIGFSRKAGEITQEFINDLIEFRQFIINTTSDDGDSNMYFNHNVTIGYMYAIIAADKKWPEKNYRQYLIPPKNFF